VLTNWRAFFLASLAYLLGGTVSTLMATYLPVVITYLAGGPVSTARMGELGALINAAFLYGWMVGGLGFGPVGDRLGRVKALTFATGLSGGATLLTAFAPNLYVLVACRFATGMGVGGVLLLATVYLSEIWPARTRPIMLGILAVTFPIGLVAAGSLNVVFPAWRQAFLMGLLPLGLALLTLTLPESAAWQRDRGNQVTGQLLAPQNRPNLLAGTLIFGSVLIGLWGLFSWLPTWVQTLLPPGRTGGTERGMTMMLLGLGGIAGGVLSGFLLNRLGNRRTLLLTFTGCAGTCVLLLLTNRHFSSIVYAELALLSLFFGISQGSLSSIIPDLFPVAIRATATGFCFNVGRFFTATAVFFVGNLVTALGGFANALLGFSAAFLIALVTVWRQRSIH